MARIDAVPDYIRRIRPYPPGQPAERLRRDLGVDHLCQLASNENTSGPSPRVREALARALDDLQFYTEGAGLELRERLAALHGVRPDEILLGNGSGEVVDLLCRAFLADGDRVVMSQLGFVQYRLSSWIVNAEIVDVPVLPGRGDDPRGFADAARTAKLVFIANPNNPTGTYLGRAALDQYFAAAGDTAVTVVDQAYHEYVDAADYPDAMDDLRAGRNVIVLRTFSKIHGLASLRIGYAIGPADLLAEVNKVRLPYNLNSLCLVAAAAALDDREHVEEAKRRNSAERAFLAAELERRGVAVTPSVANFLLVDLPTAETDWLGGLERRGVLVRTMRGYGLPASLRITVGTREENLRLLAGLDELGLARPARAPEPQ